MPNRIIREAILSSPKMASLAWPEEVFYRRLMSIVDDYGRTEAIPQLLRSRCYPLQTDDVRVADITRWMAACQKAGLILSYAAEGKQYLELIKFGQQQRSASKYPAPPALAINCEHMPANAHLDVSVSVSEDVVAAPRASRLPKDFEPNPEPEAEQGIDRVKELANFRDYWTAKPGKDGLKLDWQATWRTWARKAFRKPEDTKKSTVPMNPAELFVPEPSLTPEQLAANRERMRAEMAKLNTPNARLGAH